MPKNRFHVLIVLLILLGLSTTRVFGQDTQEPIAVSGLQIVFNVGSNSADIKIDDVRATAEVVARRLDALGIHLYVVQILNGTAIQVQLPGIDNPQSVIDTLTQTALLEVVDFSGLEDKVTDFQGSTIITDFWNADTNLPPRDDGQMNPLTNKPFKTILTGADFVSVSASLDKNFNQWVINFELTKEAGNKFGDYTQAHIGEPLAIALDGKILSIPIVQTRLDKSGVITGNFTEIDADRLAAEIQAGALPLQLTLASTDSIEAITTGSN